MEIVRAKPLPASSITATMNTPVLPLNAKKGLLRFPLQLLIDIVRLVNDYYYLRFGAYLYILQISYKLPDNNQKRTQLNAEVYQNKIGGPGGS